ncbi:MAG: VWA domain-containing protein [Phycisphaerales bacterium]|nr:MAG: VWA domain-containing protein [Phycisphaerales bacterium]
MSSGEKRNISSAKRTGQADSDQELICVCTNCNRQIRFRAKYTSKEANCPGCKAPIVLTPIEPFEFTGSSRTDRISSIAGWSTSLVLHSLLFLIFAGLTWQTGFGTGSREKGVGIVLDDAGFAESGDLDLTSPAGHSPELTVPAPSASEGDELTEETRDNSLESGVNETTSVDLELTDSTRSTGGNLGGPSLGRGGMDVPAGGWGGPGLGGSGGQARIGRGGRGGEGTFFGSRVRGQSFVYVVDRSGSMGGARIEAVKTELINSVNRLEPDQKFFIIFYNSVSHPMQANGLVLATEANKMNYLTWVRSIMARGGTHPEQAMLHALSLKPDAIWLLSDGAFSNSVCDVIRAQNPGIQIHTIAFHNQAGQAVLWRIANENGGSYMFVPPGFIIQP